MDNGFLMGMLHTFAHLDEELQPIADLELLAVAILCNRQAGHELHHKEWLPLGVVPASNTLAMAGCSMIASDCRSARNRCTTVSSYIPALISLRATCRRTGEV